MFSWNQAKARNAAGSTHWGTVLSKGKHVDYVPLKGQTPYVP